MKLLSFVILLLCVAELVLCQPAVDKSGYIVYCPCMGRFGNQAEHFLGTLDFAMKLNRTLVVPPWIQYDYSSRSHSNIFVPFKTWFSIEKLNTCYHGKIIAMEDFMAMIAPSIWTEDNRIIYCPKGSMQRSTDGKSCPAKEGKPFKPFWDNVNVDFIGGSKPFPSDVSYHSSRAEWDKAFPPEDNPVIAFIGPPASFPIQEKNRRLQGCLNWSGQVATKAREFIDGKLHNRYIALHLRNGEDWSRACEHSTSGSFHYMASAQCVGFGAEDAKKLTKKMCFPSQDDVLEKTIEVSKKFNIKTLFIGTDHEPMTKIFQDNGFEVVQYSSNDPIMDIAIMSMADAFIGNCVSSFTSFVVRQREVSNPPKPVFFFSYHEPHPPVKQLIHEEF